MNAEKLKERIAGKETFTATVTMPTRAAAELLCRDWTRKTLSGHSVGAETANGSTATLYGATAEDMAWIEATAHEMAIA